MMATEDTEAIRLNEARDLIASQTLFVNANFAVWSVETDCGGLEPEEIWRETEWLRSELLRTNRNDREHMIMSLYQSLAKKYKGKVDNVSRTVMCIMLLFANRLVVAKKDQESNPNQKVIRAIVRVLSSKMVDDGLKESMVKMLARIDMDGTDNEKKGREIPWDVDILADDPDWADQMKAVLATYADKAEAILIRNAGDAFDAIWEELAGDNLFASEMRVSSLGQNYNLKLLFAVYGLMLNAGIYTSQVKGAQSIAKVVGLNPTFNKKDNHYSKDYFNPNEIEKCTQGIKSQQMLDLVKRIIKKHTTK